jgi:hypothetical protein
MPAHTWVDAAGGFPDPSSTNAFYDAMNAMSQAVAHVNPDYRAPTWAKPTTGTPVSAAWLNDLENRTSSAAPREVVNARDFGFVGDGVADDTAAIQAALNTGNDVIISPAGVTSSHAIARTTATLVMNVAALGQRLVTRNATIQPAFIGDGIQVTTKSTVSVSISGALQPSSGDFSEVAAIRIGGTSAAYNPMQAAAPYCDIRNFNGSGIIWEHGAMIDFTHTLISDVTVDGFRCTANFDDNNHGHFLNTHVIRAGRYGYAALYGGAYTDAWNGGHASSAHQFLNAKAFGCGQNFRLETNACVGTVFSEVSTTPDGFTSTSRANNIEVISTNAAYEGWTDAGSGNRLAGYANGDFRDNKTFRTRQLQIGATNFSAVTSGQFTLPSTSIAAGASAVFTPGVTGLGTGRAVNATLFSAVGNIALTAYIDASGGLHFLATNTFGSAQTVTGIVSYVVWRFS